MAENPIEPSLKDFENEKHSLSDFVGVDEFTDIDKNRFFKVNKDDLFHTVALCKLRLIKKDGTLVNEKFIKRSSQKEGHAEKQLVDTVKRFKEDHTTTLKFIKLVVMMNYSPCEKCRPLLQDDLYSLHPNIKLLLRFSQLYHDKLEYSYREKDDDVIDKLANWLIELEEQEKCIKLEAISVVDELADYQCEVKRNRKDDDEIVKGIVKKVYEKKKDIEIVAAKMKSHKTKKHIYI